MSEHSTPQISLLEGFRINSFELKTKIKTPIEFNKLSS